MGIFDWFKDLKEKTPFNLFRRKVRRLRALLSIMEKETERENFQQLKGHLNSTILLIGSKNSLDSNCLVRLFEDERKLVQRMLDSQKKKLLQKFEGDVEKYLELFLQTLRDTVMITDSALRSWQNKQLLKTSKIEIEKKITFLEKAAADLEHLANLQREAYNEIQEEVKLGKEMPPPQNLEGTMSNGWRLSTIQKVIRQLGAWVEPGGKHDYKIIIPWATRPHTLSKDMEPYGFAASLAKLLGIPKERLIKSFNRGELVE